MPHGLYDPAWDHDACGIGVIAHIKGNRSHDIVHDALALLRRLAHRGATGADPLTGDGAGILLQLPHRFFASSDLGFSVPRRRRYGVAQVFLPQDPGDRLRCERVLEAQVRAEGQVVLGWRDVPVVTDSLGLTSRAVMPVIRQLFVARRRVAPSAFERVLYTIRKLAENRVREEKLDASGLFHVASLSSETLIYKGLLTPTQLQAVFPDLSDDRLRSAIAVVHSRFSTNTFPTWDRAQPCRFIAHNGEINTLRGNRNWMQARRAMLQSSRFKRGIDELFPIIVPGGSDSAQFDNMVELLHLGGHSLPRAMMLMIPEAFENDEAMDPDRRAFYDYGTAVLEPWDGPAAMAFTDGTLVGATLDRNGLRPARYTVTRDDRLMLASETGAMVVPPEMVLRHGRLRPGRMLLVDTQEGRIVEDDELKREIVQRFPYAQWLYRNDLTIDDLPAHPAAPSLKGDELHLMQRAFGWTDEDLEVLIGPMGQHGKEPTGSMGSDIPLAVLSDQAPPLFHYVKQLFAQVTNPPIDPIRERVVMSLRVSIGGGGNPFEESPEHCHRLVLQGPVVDNDVLARLSVSGDRATDDGGSRAGDLLEPVTLPMRYEAIGPDALEQAVEALCDQAAAAVDAGANLLVLSDRGVDARSVAMPSLLAASAVHQRLVREGTRLLTGLVVEAGDVREVHHVATLLGFGAGAVNPWLALDSLRATGGEEAAAHYIAAVEKGLLKVMSKMGISTMESYCGAQIFEIVGLADDLVQRHFTGTTSRIGGIGLRELDHEARVRHGRAFGPGAEVDGDLLPRSGVYRWRRQGERHRWTPTTVALLQHAVRQDDAATWRRYSEAVSGGDPVHLRDLLEIVPVDEAVPLEEVEPVEAIMARFCTGAMSFGSISDRAHETLAKAMNALGGRSNTGEGGEETPRFSDDRRSAIKQVASGRFGVHATYLANADELQIKVAQGAKPGEGGQLPGHKVTERIAAVRCSTPGVTLISPPPHHDIYSIEDLAQLIYDLSTVNPEARVSVKLVSEVGVGTVAAGVAKAKADTVIVAGASGGTGASPLSSLQHAGLPWELGLAETQQVLVQNRLRGRIRVQVDGGLRCARDVMVGALLGAEEFGFSTAPLISLGCILLRRCHDNSCSVGVATQDPDLVERFAGDPVHVMRFFRFLAEDLRGLMASLGFRSLDEAVGRVDRLRRRDDVRHITAATLDLSALLVRPLGADDEPVRQVSRPVRDHEGHVDQLLLERCADVVAGRGTVRLALPIGNTDRTVGAMLSGRIARAHGEAGLPDDAIHVDFDGSAGQSFGAFLSRGVSFSLRGAANDYLGKGLSGGRIAVAPPVGAPFVPEDNVIAGNTVLYGATSGELFVNGLAGERFAVRNSGARAVVEGIGDHGCEYMTGGVVVCIGPTGRNFAAGMSGGYAYVYDRDGTFRDRVNGAMVRLGSLVHESDLWLVEELLETHLRLTDSPLARRLLDNWEVVVPRFVKVVPIEYERVLQRRRAHRRSAGRREAQRV